jgi:hypothetical protein
LTPEPGRGAVSLDDEHAAQYEDLRLAIEQDPRRTGLIHPEEFRAMMTGMDEANKRLRQQADANAQKLWVLSREVQYLRQLSDVVQELQERQARHQRYPWPSQQMPTMQSSGFQ